MYRLLAAFIIIIHAVWVIFMLYGFFMAVYAMYFTENKTFLDRWLLRSIHLCGILFTTSLELTGNYCPLTLLENFLNVRAGTGAAYGGPFLEHYIEKFVYPDVNPYLLIGGAAVVAAFSLAAFIFRPPEKIRNLFGQHKARS